MLKLIGRDTSSNVMKVLWACGELDLPFEREDLGGPFGGNNSPEYLALNPNALVPTIIEDDGFVLWESNSIVRYLAAKHGRGSLCPADARVRASADRWMDWQATRVSPVMAPLFRGLIRTAEAKRDRAALGQARDRLSSLMAVMDSVLARQTYVAGRDFSMGDIPLGIAAWRWFNLPIEREDYPNLQRWFNALSNRPAYRQYIMKPLA